MTFAFLLAAVRRHLFSTALTALLAGVTAGLLGVSVALALAIWIGSAILTLELWYALEPFVVRRLGANRSPTFPEQSRLESVLGRTTLRVLVADTAELAAVRGLRSIVIGRDVLDLFEDRALSGVLTQAVDPLHAASLAGVMLVWLGNLPILGAWCVTRILGQLGRLLGVVVGTSLVIPLVLWRDGFVCWAGRLFGSMIVGLLGATLLSSGFAAAGLGLLISWLAVPTLSRLVAWENRRVERAADRAVLRTGFGPSCSRRWSYWPWPDRNQHLEDC